MKETLDEAAEKAYRFEADPMMPDKTEHQDFLRIFKKGAKWQAERMYSEEDMIAFAKYCNLKDDLSVREILTIWFDQFKKK